MMTNYIYIDIKIIITKSSVDKYCQHISMIIENLCGKANKDLHV